VQHIARAQGAPAVAAELAESEGALAAQIVWNLHAAPDAQVAAGTGTANATEGQGTAGRDPKGRMQRLFDAVELQRNRRACDRYHRVGVEAQSRTAHGDFQRSSTFVITQQAVAQAQRAAVHRA